jgi:hypothetical protein
VPDPFAAVPPLSRVVQPMTSARPSCDTSAHPHHVSGSSGAQGARAAHLQRRLAAGVGRVQLEHIKTASAGYHSGHRGLACTHTHAHKHTHTNTHTQKHTNTHRAHARMKAQAHSREHDSPIPGGPDRSTARAPGFELNVFLGASMVAPAPRAPRVTRPRHEGPHARTHLDRAGRTSHRATAPGASQFPAEQTT